MRRTSVLNRRQVNALKVVKELDAFPKVPENYQETSASGGGVSIVTFVFIFILVISELRYYTSTELQFDYEVDTATDGKLKINIDLTLAMRCDLIGADVLDVTGQDTRSFGSLQMDTTYFALSPKQQRYHDITREVNRYMREEYHAIQNLMWMSGSQVKNYKMGMPEREDKPERPPDACRVHGSLEVNKVAGNFHITAGKSVPVIPSGHAHLALMVSESVLPFGHQHMDTMVSDSPGSGGKPTKITIDIPQPKRGHYHLSGVVSPAEYNFSHRIDHFSFGDQVAGIVNPLDGELSITKQNYHIYQYFMKIVPTEVRTYANSLDTYQFSVTERNRTINHAQGSHGVPGIFVKYDLSSLKIRVREEHKPYGQFLVRLCGIVGGIFAVSGMFHGSVGFLVDVLCCRFKLGQYSKHTVKLNGADGTIWESSHKTPEQDFNHSINSINLMQEQPQNTGVSFVPENLADGDR